MLLSCNTLANFKLALLKPVGPRISLLPSKLRIEIRSRLEDVNWTLWNKLTGDSSILLQEGYLRAMYRELAEFRFVTFYNGEKAVGIAFLQITQFDSNDLSPNLDTGNRIINVLASAFKPSSDGKKLNILICGNPFATGEHAFSFDPSVKASHAMYALCRAISNILKEEKSCNRKIAGILVKDFYSPNFNYATELRKCGFRDFNVDHNMIFPVLKEWKTFDFYLASLNSKFRTKAKSTLNRSAALETAHWSAEQIASHTDEIQKLYDAVYDRADFRLGKMTMDQFVKIKEVLGDKFIFKTYHFHGKLVGFMTAFIHDHTMDAHLVGLDYSVSKELSVYPRMLYDYIELSINAGVEQLVFGRTAGEIKSAAGAIPVDLKCCIRHPGRLSNVLLTLLFSYVKPSTFERRQPYLKETMVKIGEEFRNHPIVFSLYE